MPADQLERLVATRHVYPVALTTPWPAPQPASNVVPIARQSS